MHQMESTGSQTAEPDLEDGASTAPLGLLAALCVSLVRTRVMRLSATAAKE